MTREEYIELIKAKLLRLDDASRYNPRYVEGALDFVWENFMFEMDGMQGTDPFFYTKQFTPVTVATDSNGWYYSDLPSPIINLQRVSSGVVRVSQVSGRDMDFAPVSERDFTYMRQQDVYRVGNTIYFYVTNDRVYFGDNMTPSIASSGVTIDMVVPFRSYDLDEELPIPAGKSLQFVGAVLEFLAPTRPVDLSNTNTESQ